MHNELKIIIGEFVTQIEEIADRNGCQLTSDQTEQVLAQAISTRLEIPVAEIEEIIEDLLQSES